MLSARSMNQNADSFVPEVRYADATRVACDGDNGALGHPRVWLQMDQSGFVDCGYCDRRFILVHGPADPRDKNA